MKHQAFLPLLTAVLAFFAGGTPVRAQLPDSLLREHIVHTWDANGEEVWRDDRIPTVPDTSICFIYVGRQQSGPIWLRLQVRYASYRGLFMTQIKFSKGDRTAVINCPPDMVHNGTNGVIGWEWYDSPPGEMELRVIEAIIKEPGVKLTLIGRERTVERELSELERLAIDNLLQQALVLGRHR